MSTLTAEQLRHKISSPPGEVTADIVAYAKDLAQTIKSVKTHQIRNFYGEVDELRLEKRSGEKTDEKQTKRRLYMLLPKLAYAAAKQRAVRPLYERIAPILEGVAELNGQQFDNGLDNFFDLMESLVAYHKFNE